MSRTLAIGTAVGALVLSILPTATTAQDLPDVPRNKTFIFSPWGFMSQL